MPGRRQYSLDGVAAEFVLTCNRTDQKRILAACQQLRDFPDTQSEFTRRDPTGRTIAVKIFRPFLIHYWDDFADRVVRIVRIERFN
jgi:hypothetical protein